MIRKNFYVTKDQLDFLKKHNLLTVSEHIRRSIDDYIAKLKNRDATTSPSISRRAWEGEEGGQ